MTQPSSNGNAATYRANLYINGVEIAETAAPRVDVLNPATEETLGSCPTAGAQEVESAVVSAVRGFEVWRHVTPWDRSLVLRRVAHLLRERIDALAVTVTLEIGKTLPESRAEVTACAEYFDWAAEEVRRICGFSQTGRTPGSHFEVSFSPSGVVLALTAWNFPLILASRKLSMALAAGCSVILRPAEEAPSCVAALVRCLHDAGVPAGGVNLLIGSPESIVTPLMANPAIRKVTFTGSTRVGQVLVAQSAQTVKRLTLELGGHAPFIVLEDADVEKAAIAAVAARMRCAGQVCTAPSRFYVHERIELQFTARMVELAGAIKVGDGLDAATRMGPLATARQLMRAERLVDDARVKGARIACGGKRALPLRKGFFFEPTVLTELAPDSAILNEEPFTPIAAVVRVDSAEEAVQRANETEFGLAAYVFGRSTHALQQVTEVLRAGVIGVNGVTVALPEGPFGGVKQSGYGREGGVGGVHEFLDPKFVHRMPA
jgi:succinate-semialdehyde dehydrogenase/glutarate-semialdehyde dehydrogenase